MVGYGSQHKSYICISTLFIQSAEYNICEKFHTCTQQ